MVTPSLCACAFTEQPYKIRDFFLCRYVRFHDTSPFEVFRSTAAEGAGTISANLASHTFTACCSTFVHIHGVVCTVFARNDRRLCRNFYLLLQSQMFLHQIPQYIRVNHDRLFHFSSPSLNASRIDTLMQFRITRKSKSVSLASPFSRRL